MRRKAGSVLMRYWRRAWIVECFSTLDESVIMVIAMVEDVHTSDIRDGEDMLGRQY